MDGWLNDVEFYERVIMAKARTSRTLTDGDIDRMVSWSLFADKSWAHTAGLGSLYAKVIGSRPPPPEFPSIRLLAAIVNNAFLPSTTVHKAVQAFSQQLAQVGQHSLELFMLMNQRKELMSFLEDFVVPSLRGQRCDGDSGHLKAIVKELLLSDSKVPTQSSDSTCHVRLIRVAHTIEQNSSDSTSLRWLLSLLLQTCQSEEEQQSLLEQMRTATTNLSEE